MARFCEVIHLVFLLFLSMVMLQACAKKPYLELEYQLPAPSAALKASQTCLKVKDIREDPEIFGNAAKKEFENFSGFFSLSVVSVDKKRSQIGAYELAQLFQKTLEKRLQNMGVEVLKECAEGKPVLQAQVKIFKIDLVEGRWRADVSYEAGLTRDGKNIVKEAVSGKAERVKLVGGKAAQRVVGELFTDMINRLDIYRLFAEQRP